MSNLLDNYMVDYNILTIINSIYNLASQTPSPCQSKDINDQNPCQSKDIILPVKGHHLASQRTSKLAILPVKGHVSIEVYRSLYRDSIEPNKKRLCFRHAFFIGKKEKKYPSFFHLLFRKPTNIGQKTPPPTPAPLALRAFCLPLAKNAAWIVGVHA